LPGAKPVHSNSIDCDDAQTWTPDKVHGAEIGLTLASAVIVVAHFVTLKIAAR
jgi:hypothetical protein